VQSGMCGSQGDRCRGDCECENSDGVIYRIPSLNEVGLLGLPRRTGSDAALTAARCAPRSGLSMAPVTVRVQ
jgi:hypothetical protein